VHGTETPFDYLRKWPGAGLRLTDEDGRLCKDCGNAKKRVFSAFSDVGAVNYDRFSLHFQGKSIRSLLKENEGKPYGFLQE